MGVYEGDMRTFRHGASKILEFSLGKPSIRIIVFWDPYWGAQFMVTPI